MCSQCPFCGSSLTLADLFKHLRQACVVFTVVADAIDDALYEDTPSDDEGTFVDLTADQE